MSTPTTMTRIVYCCVSMAKIVTQTRHSIRFYLHFLGDRGSTVVKVLCYKSEGRWFDPTGVNGFFIDIKFFRSHYGPGVDSASNINEYQEYFLRVKAAGA